VPLHDGDAGRTDAALGDRQQRVHPELGQGLDVEDLDLKAGAFQLLHAIGELDGAKHVGGLVDQVAGDVNAAGHGALGFERGAGLVGIGAVDD
jgi:hypothetical protein